MTVSPRKWPLAAILSFFLSSVICVCITEQQRIQDFRSARNLKEPGTGTPRHDHNSRPKPNHQNNANVANVHSGNKRKGLNVRKQMRSSSLHIRVMLFFLWTSSLALRMILSFHFI